MVGIEPKLPSVTELCKLDLKLRSQSYCIIVWCELSLCYLVLLNCVNWT